MHIRTIAPTVTLALLATAVAACGGASTNKADSTTLTYWASNQGSSLTDDQQVLEPQLAKFTKETGIKVNLQVIGWPDLLNKILAATTSGQGPDVLNIGNTWSASLQATGALLPWTSANLAKIGGGGRFVASSLAATGESGKPPTAVPLYSLAYGLYYNKQMFAAAGIKQPPATWPELVADAKKLTHGGQYGLTLQAGQVTENAHFASILGYQQGADLFNSAGKPDLATPQEVAAIKQYVDFMATDKIVNPSDAEYTATPTSITDLTKGKVAMFMAQASDSSFQQAGMNMNNLGLAPIPFPAPPIPGAKHVDSFVAGINMAIFKNTKNLSGAMKFVKFMTSTSEQQILNKTYGSMPSVTAAYNDPAFETPHMKVFEQVLQNSATPLPEVPQESQFETVVGTAMKTLFADAATGKPVTDALIMSQLQAADQQLAAGG